MADLRVLVVEDEAAIVETIAARLPEAWRVRAVRGVVAALEALQAETWDAILLDLVLPGYSLAQLEALDAVAPHRGGAALVVLSAGPLADRDRVRAAGKGADFVVDATRIPADLREILVQLVRQRWTEEPAPTVDDASGVRVVLADLAAAGQEIPVALLRVEMALARQTDRIGALEAKWGEHITAARVKGAAEAEMRARGDQVIAWLLVANSLVAPDELPALREDLRSWRALSDQIRPWAAAQRAAAETKVADATESQARLRLIEAVAGTEGGQELMKAIAKVAAWFAALAALALEVWWRLIAG